MYVVGDASKWPTHNTRDFSVSADKLRDGQAARLQTGFTGTCYSLIIRDGRLIPIMHCE